MTGARALGPWGDALGAAVADLHPQLVRYVEALPPGVVGIGEGTYDRVGTPRRWLWPALAVLGSDGVLFPVWERDVPFTIENRLDAGVLRSRRTFRLRRGERVMVDAVRRVDGRLEDRVGRRGSVRVALVAEVRDGALELKSGAAWVLGIRVPGFLAPRLRLTERWDESAQRQHVSLTIDAPLVGRVYEYTGSFRYRIEPALSSPEGT